VGTDRPDHDGRTLTEFAIPTATAGPFGITAGRDGNLWFAEKARTRSVRITTGGAITEFAVRRASAGPFGITAGPDGNPGSSPVIGEA